jgi:hypothetical protein
MNTPLSFDEILLEVTPNEVREAAENVAATTITYDSNSMDTAIKSTVVLRMNHHDVEQENF